jgi:sugar lactone lactonase YvrE
VTTEWSPANPMWALATTTRAELGERPVWDDVTQSLVWVDIEAFQVRRLTPATGVDVVVHQADAPVGCVALRENGGLVAGIGRQVVLLDTDGTVSGTIDVPGEDDVVFNDGAVDPAGRFIAGTSTAATRSAGGALYAFDADHGMHLLVDGITESNGIGWSPDGATMYYVDSGETVFGAAARTVVRSYAYDVATGEIERGADLASLTEGEGIPDGLVVDAQGAVWLAVWGGSEIRRYAPDGILLDSVALPASLITCPGFGGPDLTDLYVTSAQSGMDAAARAAEPHAGQVFRLRPGVAGLPATRYRG